MLAGVETAPIGLVVIYFTEYIPNRLEKTSAPIAIYTKMALRPILLLKRINTKEPTWARGWVRCPPWCFPIAVALEGNKGKHHND